MSEIELRFSNMNIYAYFREGIGDLLRDWFPDGHTLIEIAINEAINNAFFHGSRFSAKPLVLVRIGIIDGPKLVIRIKDRGEGFHSDNNRGDAEKSYATNLSESGRGLLIMKHVFDEVTYNKRGNEVTLIKRINMPGKDV